MRWWNALFRKSRLERELGGELQFISTNWCGLHLMETALRDVRYALRTLRASPAFTLTAIISLALGIGANTAIFTLLHASLWKALPVREPGRIYQLLCTAEGAWEGDFSFSYPFFRELAERGRVYGDIVAKSSFGLQKFSIGGGPTERVVGEGVSANFFQRLQLDPFHGRLFEPADDSVSGGNMVAVLSHKFWTAYFHGDPSVIGKTVLYNEKLTIVGVAQPGFTGLQAQHVTLRPARSGMATMGRQYQKPLLVLMAVVVLILLISCANVANLLLARNTARSHEIALRLALGASRGRIVKQLLAETLLLAFFGAAAGVLVAPWVSALLLGLLPAQPQQLAFDLRPDSAVLGFTAAVAAAASLLFGMAPALRSSRPASDPILRSGAHASPRTMAGKVLVVAQLALSLLLLVGAGLFIGTLRHLQLADLGFRADHVLAVDLSFPRETPRDRMREAYTRILENLEAQPGVAAASYAWPDIYNRGGWSGGVTVEGRASRAGEDNEACLIAAGPGFFETMRIGLLQGRYLAHQDQPQSPRVAVVNESFARAFFGDRPPLGHHLTLAGEPNAAREIVGVVRDARHYGVREKPCRMVYMPALQTGDFMGGSLFLRGDNPQMLSSIARSRIPRAGGSTRIERIRPFQSTVDDLIAKEKLLAVLSGAFAVLALVLACVGLYGVMTYQLWRRTGEMGIRIALGATSGELLRLVARETLWIVCAGVLLGLPAAMALSRLVLSMLYGVRPMEPRILAGAMLLFGMVAGLAAYLPARRASHTDPMAALRHD